VIHELDDAGMVRRFLASTSTVTMIWPTPPRACPGLYTDASLIITLQCVTQSVAGGETVLASGRAAYEFVAALYPTTVALFARPDALTISRAGHSSCGPIFRQVGERCHVRLRLPSASRR
jgi:hypothetical protein